MPQTARAHAKPFVGRWIAVGAAVGGLVAAAALVEAALIPGLAIGAVAVVGPRLWSARPNKTRPRPRSAPLSSPRINLRDALTNLHLSRAVVKTITFRIIVVTLDFSVNYFVLGDLALAAGLSTFAIVAGPVFYFVHETAWNWYGKRLGLEDGGEIVRFAGLPMSRALAKTITYRTLATISEFTATYVVVGDLATAALLSSFGFVLGPFVYYGHEKLWERFDEADVSPPQEPLCLTYAGA